MFSWLYKRARREALQQFTIELYNYNDKDACWDPIGSMDLHGMNHVIEFIAQGKLKQSSVLEAKHRFKKVKYK